MRSTELTVDGPPPIKVGSGRLARFLAGSAAFGSLIIALLVVLAGLDDESEDRSAFIEEREP